MNRLFTCNKRFTWDDVLFSYSVGLHVYPNVSWFNAVYIFFCIQVPYPQRNRAFRTIPDGFAIKTSSIPKAGLGVWTTKDIPKCIIIGPYGGEKVFNNDNSTRYYAWAVRK